MTLYLGPNTLYNLWLMEVSLDNHDKAVERAEELIEHIICHSGPEPSWGGRMHRDNFIIWCRSKNLDGSWNLETAGERD